MDATIGSAKNSKAIIWISYVISAIPVFFLTMSGIMKLFPGAVAEGFGQLGWPVGLSLTLAIIELGCVVFYLIPRTAVLGAILIAAYLGGATATHVRVGDGWFFMAVILGILAWLGLWLREPRLRALLPLRS